MTGFSGTQRVQVGQIALAYEAWGNDSDPPVVLIMGLATQMLGWPEDFCADLARRGHYVIRFDNRDVGLSTHLDDAAPGDVAAVLAGDVASVAYRLTDMAADTVGLLDALGIDAAHIVGASMGGMIAQTIAIEHPERVRSLTSIMSATGDPAVGDPTPEAMAVLMAPPATDRASAIDRAVKAYRTIGSPGFPPDENAVRERAARSFDRRFDPVGASRQLVGILASGDRTEQLRRADVPTLVVHGADDPLVRVSGGRATAAAIPNSDLLVIDGMGHDLPSGVWPRLIDAISSLVRRVEASTT